MKKYMSPTIIEFGKAIDSIQGCGGWGSEAWTFDDSRSQFRWIQLKGQGGDRSVCVCTSISSEEC
ncbi:hypothetical protein OCF62_28395 [Bacillus wiedmannii]|uniref:hypothetical protein n=1 Tax=Bacillus wiedmannii TaxID=1890302 RepID=UPI000BF42F5B|nr:hypothetical protein [Bacillus wiedmannii]MCU5518411.1 hypothetical protein [Bacillus wiedmannii]MCU5518414.1 hypothetical protein [Bacillus wiedmannii]PGE25261.1 hypothetical protein COM52_28305 [Bacillus wiedmannii]